MFSPTPVGSEGISDKQVDTTAVNLLIFLHNFLELSPAIFAIASAGMKE